MPLGTKHKLISKISSEYGYLDEVVDKMRSQDPLDRFHSIQDLKEKLISRRNDFVSLQKVNELRNAVVPESEIDDPLTEPIRVVEKDYLEDRLVFVLNKSPNLTWIQLFQNQTGDYSFIGDARPDRFELIRNRVYVLADESIVVQVVNHFIGYVGMANRKYAAHISDSHRAQSEAHRRALLAELEAEEKRRVLNAISAQ